MNTITGKMGDYGIDAPPVVRNLMLGAMASLVAGIVLYVALASVQPVTAVRLLIGGLSAGAALSVTVLLLVWSSKVGKLRLREKLIDALALRGTETVVDVGCGRGLLLNGAAAPGYRQGHRDRPLAKCGSIGQSPGGHVGERGGRRCGRAGGGKNGRYA